MRNYPGCTWYPLMLLGGFLMLYGAFAIGDPILKFIVVFIGLAMVFVGPGIVSSLMETEEEKKIKEVKRIAKQKKVLRRFSGYGYSEYPENWSEVRRDALSRDGYQCGNCGSSDTLEVHHIVPLSKGGTNNLSNLQTLCRDCHKRIHPHL